MNESDFDRFERALNELACSYLLRIEGDELAAYFRVLSRFAIELIERLLPEALRAHPTYFPKAGELLTLCDAVVADHKRSEATDSVSVIRAMNSCEHVWEFEPEADSALWAGFHTCARCRLSKPHLRADAAPAQVEYLQQALSANRQLVS